MAKKSDKKKGNGDAERGSTAESLLGAFERTFQSTGEGTRGRAQELMDEVVSVAGRVREAIEDIRLSDEVRSLRAEVESLRERVAALEARPVAAAQPETEPEAPAKPAPRRRATTTAASGRSGSGRSQRPAAAKSSSSAPRASGTRRARSIAQAGAEGASRTTGNPEPSNAPAGPPPSAPSGVAPSTEPAPEASTGRS